MKKYSLNPALKGEACCLRCKDKVACNRTNSRGKQSHQQLWGKIDSLMDDDDDKEVLAIAALATHGTRHIYTADTRLLHAAEKVAQEIKAITPRELLDIVEQAGQDRDS